LSSPEGSLSRLAKPFHFFTPFPCSSEAKAREYLPSFMTRHVYIALADVKRIREYKEKPWKVETRGKEEDKDAA
jgi:hypothetical protein